jgi:hypothetical protein
MTQKFDLIDVENIEGNATSEEDYFCSLQRAINSGSAWSLQGSYGRAMMDALDSGSCMLGPTEARDYWGNHIPSRDQVQAGSKGSRAFVVKHRDEDWAVMLDNA